MSLSANHGQLERGKPIFKSIMTLIFTLFIISSAFAATYYEIEVAHDDELFIINDEKYRAKTYCFGWDEGDMVTFLEGSEYGACVSAVLYNQNRRETCEVWCE